jgi:hypothetical protein
MPTIPEAPHKGVRPEAHVAPPLPGVPCSTIVIDLIVCESLIVESSSNGDDNLRDFTLAATFASEGR